MVWGLDREAEEWVSMPFQVNWSQHITSPQGDESAEQRLRIDYSEQRF